MKRHELEHFVAAHTPLVGRVWSGTNSSYWYVWLHRAVFKKLLGGKAIDGSLNIWFTQELVFKHPIKITAKAERWNVLWIQPVILSKDGRKFEHGLALRRGAKDSRAWIEIFAKVYLRTSLKLKDNDVVSVWQVCP